MKNAQADWLSLPESVRVLVFGRNFEQREFLVETLLPLEGSQSATVVEFGINGHPLFAMLRVHHCDHKLMRGILKIAKRNNNSNLIYST